MMRPMVKLVFRCSWFMKTRFWASNQTMGPIVEGVQTKPPTARYPGAIKPSSRQLSLVCYAFGMPSILFLPHPLTVEKNGKVSDSKTIYPPAGMLERNAQQNNR